MVCFLKNSFWHTVLLFQLLLQQILEPQRNAWLVRTLHGLQMLLPQVKDSMISPSPSFFIPAHLRIYIWMPWTFLNSFLTEESSIIVVMSQVKNIFIVTICKQCWYLWLMSLTFLSSLHLPRLNLNAEIWGLQNSGKSIEILPSKLCSRGAIIWSRWHAEDHFC